MAAVDSSCTVALLGNFSDSGGVRDQPCRVDDVRIEVVSPGPEGSEPKPLRLSQSILDRELDRVYEAKTLKEVHEALETSVEHLRQLETFEDITALIDAEPQDEPDACTVQLVLQEVGRYRFGGGTYTQAGDYLKAALRCSCAFEGGGRSGGEVLPTEGWQVRLSGELGGAAPGSSNLRYIRQQTQLSWAAPLADGISFHVEGAAGLVFRLPGKAGGVGVHAHVFANGGSAVLLTGGGSGSSSGGGSGGIGGLLAAVGRSVKAGVQQMGHTFRWSTGVGLVFPTQLGRLEANYCWVLTSQEYDRVKRGFSFGFAANMGM
eukprot:gene9504-9667_t